MSINEYARVTGREAPPPDASPAQANPSRPARPLTEREQARVAENRALVREHLPEAMPFIKDLHEAGLIEGWRNVETVEVFTDSNQGGRP